MKSSSQLPCSVSCFDEDTRATHYNANGNLLLYSVYSEVVAFSDDDVFDDGNADDDDDDRSPFQKAVGAKLSFYRRFPRV